MQRAGRAIDALELGLALAGALIVWVSALMFWQAASDLSQEWPLAIFFGIEWTALGILGPVAAWLDERRVAGDVGRWLLWACAGALLPVGMLLLGTGSPFVVGAVLTYVLAGVLANRRRYRGGPLQATGVTLLTLVLAFLVSIANLVPIALWRATIGGGL